MNSLYLILIAICFTAGVFVSSAKIKDNPALHQATNEVKKEQSSDLKVKSTEQSEKDIWYFFKKN